MPDHHDDPCRTEAPDWAHSIGMAAGLALAVGLELVEAPVAVMLVAAPLLGRLDDRRVPAPLRAAGRILRGASVPLGGPSATAGAVRTLVARLTD